MLELNDNPTVRVETVAGLFPILYIDDFYADPMAVRDFALKNMFDQGLAFYPGRHAPLTENTEFSEDVRAEISEACSYVCEMIKTVSSLDISHEDIRTDFSVITTPARDLLKYQKHPHIDPTPILCLIYLNPEDMGGTSFWRNTAIDRLALVTAEDKEAYGKFMAEAPVGETREDYAMVHVDSWEKVHSIDFKFNRFVAYPANIFHWVECKFVPEPTDLSKCRLTQRFNINRVTAA